MRLSIESLRMTLVSLVLLGAIPQAGAYPISPVPLWDLTREADMIVLADVLDVVPATGPFPVSMLDAPSSSRIDGAGSMALLRVRESWKGEVLAAVNVNFDSNMMCPAAPRYAKGKVVAAFLGREEDHWSTVALSYGTLYPAAGEIEDFRARVKEAVELQARPELDPEDKTEWLVRAASRPSTRWHGLYELIPESDGLHFYYDQKGGTRTGREHLTPAQLTRIARGFVTQPSVDRTLPMILSLFQDLPYHAFDRAAIAVVEALLLRDTVPWWFDDALEPLLKRLGDPDPESRLRSVRERFERKDMKALREIWKQTKKDLDLPEVPAARDQAAEVWGVGSNTPD